MTEPDPSAAEPAPEPDVLSFDGRLTRDLREVDPKPNQKGELGWLLGISFIPFLIDFIAKSAHSSEFNDLVGFSTLAFSLFALSAGGFARAVQNRAADRAMLLFIACFAQGTLAVTVAPIPPSVVQWIALSSSVAATGVGLVLTWRSDPLPRKPRKSSKQETGSIK